MHWLLIGISHGAQLNCRCISAGLERLLAFGGKRLSAARHQGNCAILQSLKAHMHLAGQVLQTLTTPVPRPLIPNPNPTLPRNPNLQSFIPEEDRGWKQAEIL